LRKIGLGLIAAAPSEAGGDPAALEARIDEAARLPQAPISHSAVHRHRAAG
jgi:hypothetical protein